MNLQEKFTLARDTLNLSPDEQYEMLDVVCAHACLHLTQEEMDAVKVSTMLHLVNSLPERMVASSAEIMTLACADLEAQRLASGYQVAERGADDAS
jgi:hypothetical protein